MTDSGQRMLNMATVFRDVNGFPWELLCTTRPSTYAPRFASLVRAAALMTNRSDERSFLLGTPTRREVERAFAAHNDWVACDKAMAYADDGCLGDDPIDMAVLQMWANSPVSAKLKSILERKINEDRWVLPEHWFTHETKPYRFTLGESTDD